MPVDSPWSQGSIQEMSVGLDPTSCKARTKLCFKELMSKVWSPPTKTEHPILWSRSFHIHGLIQSSPPLLAWTCWDKYNQSHFVDDQTEAQLGEQLAQDHRAPKQQVFQSFHKMIS